MPNIKTLYYDQTWLGYHYDIAFNYSDKTVKFNIWIAVRDYDKICNIIDDYMKENYSCIKIDSSIYYIFEDETEYNRFYFEHA